ncbi:Hypothetical predicted protein [Mytilus galloprovincialis]|uniref:C1q domain-containing protein n=1 Tax=Mytilus galloprovincialis TaxID=29158 RepID=A0A8B6EKT0_MYTGA|nr:Hypothetical predicted protein [Mytilus galloprovincialis]
MIQMENTIHGLSTRLAEKDKEVLALQNITHILTETNAQKDRLILQLSSNLTALQFEERRIAFHARMSTDKTHLASFATVKFETIVTNEGQAYSPVTDGNTIAYTHDEANSSTDHKASSQSAVVLLKKGNKTWIRAHGSEGRRCYPKWSSYSGFKV